MSWIENAPDWVVLILALGLFGPAIAAFALGTWTAAKDSAHRVKEAADKSLWDAAKTLWAEGQQIKELLDKHGSRADFVAKLREAGKIVLLRYGLPLELVDILLERARSIHKERKQDRPKSVVILNQKNPGEDPKPEAAQAPQSPESSPPLRGSEPTEPEETPHGAQEGLPEAA